MSSSQDGESNGPGKMSAGEEEGQESASRSHKNNNVNNNSNYDYNDPVVGSSAMRPVFLGNLIPNYTPETVCAAFERPTIPNADPVPVDRVDVKRGYCFVFLKDARNESDKRRIEEFVSKINGIEIPSLSRSVRAEFARGDGRVKRKEDERRKNIAPSETLFVVNFHEETTKKEDLEMLFSPYGELVRIDMKRNYAFVQFKTIEQATRAKENTNGGKIDQSVLTVEYVARQRMNEPLRGSSRGRDSRGGGGGGGRDRDRYPMDDRGRGPPPRYDDRGRGGYYSGPAAPPPPQRPAYGGRSYDDDRHGPRGGGGRGGRSPSPPPYRRGRSRSRSPPPRYGGGRSRSPPSRRSYEDDYHRGSSSGYRRGASRSPSPPRRGASPEQDRDFYRGDRDRGYRG